MVPGFTRSLLAKVALVAGSVLFGVLLHASLPERQRDPELVLRLRELRQGLEAVNQTMRAQSARLEALSGRVQTSTIPKACPPGRQALEEERSSRAQEKSEAERAPARNTPPPTAENDAARAEADELVTAAKSAGRWGPDDARRFRQLLVQMADSQRDALIQRLTVTLNSGELEVETGGAPF